MKTLTCFKKHKESQKELRKEYKKLENELERSILIQSIWKDAFEYGKVTSQITGGWNGGILTITRGKYSFKEWYLKAQNRHEGAEFRWDHKKIKWYCEDNQFITELLT